MLFLLSIAGAAALAVYAYNHLRRRDPDLDDTALVTVQQLAAVITVVTTAVEGVLSALREPRGAPQERSGSYAWPAWDDLDGVRP